MDRRIAYAVCRGTYHIQKEIPCQDAADGRKWEKHAAVALADGAGSCRFSQNGAKTVVETVLSLLEKEGEAWLSGVTDGAAERVVAACLESLANNPHELAEQASTLLFCMVDEDGSYLCGHLGDGYLFRVTGKEAELLSSPENGATLNETVFVTSACAEKHLRLQKGTLETGDAIILCSDGSGESLYAREEQCCAPALVHMAEWLGTYKEEEVALALEHNLDQVFRNASSDDMSLAIITCW